MKILALTNLYPPDVIGGYELGCRQAVDALRARGHDVLVLTSAPRTPAPSAVGVVRDLQLGEIWNHYLFRHSRPVTAHLLQARAMLVNALNVHTLTRTVEDFRPDVAYVWNLVGVGGLGLMAALQHLQVPWLWHLMDDVPLALCRVGERPLEPLLREMTRQLDGRFLACSRQLVEEVEAGGVDLEGRVEVVPNWVVGPPVPPRSEVYRAGSGRPLRVMSAGQVNRNKGVDHLIEAAALLRRAGRDDFVIDLFGQAEDAYFEAFARYRGVARHVRFRGTRPQAELSREYDEHDLFAFPTWAREPFAFAPLEASLRGCVPLMSQLGGNAEWAVHGVHGLKAGRSPESFAEALLAVMDGDVDLEPLARRASAVVGRDFHLDRILPRIERALARAADSRRAGARAGTAAEAYRMALLAEKLSRVFVAEMIPVD